MSKAEMMRQANKCFPSIHGTKKNAPSVLQILSMQSILPPIFTGKRPIDEAPRGPVRVRVFRLNSQTRTESLARAFTPRWAYQTEHHPHKMIQLHECREALSSAVCLVYATSGMGAAETTALRAKLNEEGVRTKFAKPALLRLALHDKGFPGLAALSKGQLLLVHHPTMEPSELKKAFQTVQTNKRMILISGIVEGTVWSPAQIVRLVEQIPSRAAMMGELVHLVASPMRQFVGCLEHPLNQMVRSLEGRIDQIRIDPSE